MAKWSKTLAAAVALAWPFQLSAHGETTQITLTCPDWPAPLEVKEPAKPSLFQVFAGPGASSREPQSLIVDWERGVVTPPANLKPCTVAITVDRPGRNVYVVRYAIDPATGQGYVYLPGRGEPAYEGNVWLILRKVEGNWFRAWDEWDKIAKPLIQRARSPR